MQTFSVYHLNHDAEHHKDLLKVILSSNRGLDETIIKQYASSDRHELEIRDKFKMKTPQEFIESKCRAVLQMMAFEGYIHAADVQANNLVDVIKKTNSINGYWFMQKRKGVKMVSLSERDTRSFDVITTEDKVYLINSVGFIDVNKMTLFKVNV